MFAFLLISICSFRRKTKDHMSKNNWFQFRSKHFSLKTSDSSNYYTILILSVEKKKNRSKNKTKSEDSRCFHCFKTLLYEYDGRREEYIPHKMHNTK